MTKTELRMLYKAETAQSSIKLDCFARVGKFGDVILDQFSLDDDFIREIENKKELVVPNSDYVSWLEEKVMELLTKLA